MDKYNNSTAELKAIFSEEVMRVMCPELKYPMWEKRLIKRKYGKHSAVYLDVFVPYLPTLLELLPKTPHINMLEDYQERYAKALNENLFKDMGVELEFR